MATIRSVSKCVWEDEEIQFLIEEVAALDPDLRSNAMLTQKQKYGDILSRLNNLFHQNDRQKNTFKTLAQMVTKLGKLKAEAKKVSKTFKAFQRQVDKLPTGSSAEARAEAEDRLAKWSESVEKKHPWYFSYMEELGSDDPVLQGVYDEEIGLSDNSHLNDNEGEGEENSASGDDGSPPQESGDRTPLSDVTNKRPRTKEGGPPTQSRPKRQRQTRDIKQLIQDGIKQQGAEGKSYVRQLVQEIEQKQQSAREQQQQFFSQLFDKHSSRSESFLITMVNTILSNSTANTPNSAAHSNASFGQWGSDNPSYGGYQG